MASERYDPRARESLQTHQIPLIALEGVGGSGKSHTGELVTSELQRQGVQIISAKVSGLGDSQRVQKLKAINDHRESLLRDGNANEKVKEDKRRDKIFRLATRHQVQLLLTELDSSTADLGILDRTPIMPWVYASASDPDNPYLDEILADGIAQTNALGISTIYYLQITPETAYSRIVARACVLDDRPEQKAAELCQQIGADPESTQEIIEKSLNLITNNPRIKPKDYRSWDFIPYPVMAGECERYVEVLEMLQSQHGINFVPVDAEVPVDQVVSSILGDIQTRGTLQNL